MEAYNGYSATYNGISKFSIGFIGFFFLVFTSGANASVIVSEGFESGTLASFVSSGGVTVGDLSGNSVVEMTDYEYDFSNPVDTTLSQSFLSGAGSYTFSFEYNANIAQPIGAFDFPDVFQASIYFTNDIDSFDIFDAGSYEVLDLFSLDSLGLTSVDADVAIGNGGIGNQVSIDFVTEFSYVIPYFSLLEIDYIAENSTVYLDNLVLEKNPIVVPEPGVLWLFLVGIAGLAMSRFNLNK